MKRFTLIILTLLTAIMVKAHDVEVDGVYYNLNKEDKTATVTYKGTSYYEYKEYSGEVYIPKTITYDDVEYTVNSIGKSAFEGCDNLTAITCYNAQVGPYLKFFWNISSIGDDAFYGCTALKSIRLLSPLKSIGSSAFYNCTALTGISLPSTLETIGKDAFLNCSKIKSVYLDNQYLLYTIKFGSKYSNPLYYGHHAYYDKEITYPEGQPKPQYPQHETVELTTLDVPENITSINDYTFVGWHGITSATIPSSITSIGISAFENCDSLKELVIPNSVKTIGSYAFNSCDSLSNVTIGDSVATIGKNAFFDCSKLNNVYIDDFASWCNISFESSSSTPLCYAQHFFVNGEEIKELIIPEDIKNISAYAFYGFKTFSSVVVPNIIENVGTDAFGNATYKIYCYPKAYLKLYNEYKSRAKMYGAPIYRIYDYDARKTTIEVFLEQTDFVPAPEGKGLTATPYISLSSNGSELISLYSYGAGKYSGTIRGLYPGQEVHVYSFTKYSDGTTIQYNDRYMTTEKPWIGITAKVSPTTIKWHVNIDAGNATIESVKVTSNGYSVNDSRDLLITGLDPETVYGCKVDVTCKEGGGNNITKQATTEGISLETLQTKCVSSSCAIVAAKTNVADIETGLGFQWKKYDAPESLEPKEGYAAIYNGQMEGYIKNLQPTYYNVRAFYKSASGKYYYGDWVTFDQTDFSYFEPTVHTYADITTTENTAMVRGYVMAGTDNIKEQGFEYWETANPANAKKVAAALALENNIMTVLSSGQVMQTVIENLKPSTTYGFRAFARTDSGTTYGEEQTFTTAQTSGIVSVTEESQPTVIIGYYDTTGRRLPGKQKGINIIRYSDGSSRKMYVK